MSAPSLKPWMSQPMPRLDTATMTDVSSTIEVEGDVAAPVLTTICLLGIDLASPLAQSLALGLQGSAHITSSRSLPPITAAWRVKLTSTLLQYWGDTAYTLDTIAPTADVTVDLHGLAISSPGRIWRVVDYAGRCALSPFFARDCCHQGRRVASLFLIESTDGGTSWGVLDDAHLSGAVKYRDLLQRIGAAIPMLIANGLRSRSRPVTWRPEKPGSTLGARFGHPLSRLVAWCRSHLTSDVWAIGVSDRSLEDLVEGGKVLPRYWLRVPEQEGYIADPFPWPGRENVILCERFSLETGRGSLQCLTIRGTQITHTEEVDLGTDCHLSYPSTFKDGNRVVCLPEMGASRHQVIYQLEPGQAARPICVIAENRALADATLFRHAGLYFIAYTDMDLGVHDNLCLLWATRLEGPWTQHRQNPVKIDVRSSRGAGCLFTVNDRLLRPAQDCSQTYGGALVINRVVVCTTEEYREEPVARLIADPSGPFPSGLHTLSVINGVVLVDCKKIIVNPRILAQRLRRRMRLYRPAGWPSTLLSCVRRRPETPYAPQQQL